MWLVQAGAFACTVNIAKLNALSLQYKGQRCRQSHMSMQCFAHLVKGDADAIEMSLTEQALYIWYKFSSIQHDLNSSQALVTSLLTSGAHGLSPTYMLQQYIGRHCPNCPAMKSSTCPSIDNLSISHGRAFRKCRCTRFGISVIHRRDNIVSYNLYAFQVSHGWETVFMHSGPGRQRVILLQWQI